MDNTFVVVYVPVDEDVDDIHTLPAASAERLFTELNLPENAVLVIKRQHGAVAYGGHTLSAEESRDFMVRFGGDL